jgi:cysteine synthase A
MTGAFECAVEAYQTPRLIKLRPNLYGVCFTLMKMIPARYILRQAADRGQLEPGTVIVETTSGTFGLALAMEAVHQNRRLILVSDPVVDARLYRRLTDLGATVERVPAAAGRGPGGFQTARLDRVAEVRAELAAEGHATFCPEQYSNPDNPRSYATVADQLLASLGQVDCVVGPVGSGGSMSGTVSCVRSVSPDCRAIAVDTQASVLFGPPDGHRELRGLGMSVVPANLDYRVLDDVHWVSASLAYAATRRLHRQHALFMGPTSGAAFQVANWHATNNPDSMTVVMMPDEGYRYLDTVYDDEWLQANGHGAPADPAHPVATTDSTRPPVPPEAAPRDRRSHAEVVSGQEPAAAL